MTRSRIGAVLLALVATLAMAATALATQARPVTITVESTIGGSDDPFVATGGVVCDEGDVSNARGNFVGWQSNTQAQIQLIKHFECEDGTFDVLLRVALDFATCDTVGTWAVIDGAGAYERLRGTGSLTGDGDCGGNTILDVYEGSMHLN